MLLILLWWMRLQWPRSTRMSSQWTVTPDVVRVELRYGDAPFWIELKKELTTGEQKRLYAAGFRSWSKTTPGVQEAGEEARRLNIHWDQMVFEKVRTYQPPSDPSGY